LRYSTDGSRSALNHSAGRDAEAHALLAPARRADAHSELARWLSGDRRTNDELRGHAI
jgi:hypothetical protein